MVVGGWFDAEDLFGALHTYEAIEKQSPGNKNYLVMGPWTHGAWAASSWTKFGTYDFGANVNDYFKDSLETKFFNFYLKDKGSFNAAEATVYETGTNEWKHFDQWPPANSAAAVYYLESNRGLSQDRLHANGSDQYISDPASPVPYTNGVYNHRNNGYMVEDQRFAAKRPDVLAYKSTVLNEDVTIAGKITADLFVSVSTTDADFIIKIIDVLPDSTAELSGNDANTNAMAGFERLVRAEVMRGKFRNSYEKPEPFVPKKITEVKINLNDVLHTFKKGHRIMVQIQSSWFPLIDMNPQKFMRIPDADKSDFQKAIIHIYHDGNNQSKITLPIMKN